MTIRMMIISSPCSRSKRGVFDLIPNRNQVDRSYVAFVLSIQGPSVLFIGDILDITW